MDSGTVRMGVTLPGRTVAPAGGASASASRWHFLYFFPLPHQQGSLGPEPRMTGEDHNQRVARFHQGGCSGRGGRGRGVGPSASAQAIQAKAAVASASARGSTLSRVSAALWWKSK